MVKLSLIFALLKISPLYALSCQFSLNKSPLIQGDTVYGKIDVGYLISLDNKIIPTTNDGRFVVGINRDAGKNIAFTLTNKKTKEKSVCKKEVKPFSWKIDRVNGVAAGKVTPKPEFTNRIAKENNIIKTARKVLDLSQFPDNYTFPVTGRISGVFGSQRIFNGQKRAPHSGIDIAAPNGTPVKSIADGTVLVAYDEMFFNGRIILIDHGFYVNSTYAHLNKINVKVGDKVKQGDIIGEVGSTGRSTGNHLHITVNIFGNNIDPLRILKKPAPITEKIESPEPSKEKP